MAVTNSTTLTCVGVRIECWTVEARSTAIFIANPIETVLIFAFWFEVPRAEFGRGQCLVWIGSVEQLAIACNYVDYVSKQVSQTIRGK